MPKAALKGLKKTIKGGNCREGVVKNMTNEGKYDPVAVWIKPKLDGEVQLIGLAH